MPTRLESVRQLDFAPKGLVFPSPYDWRDQFLYQLLVDRFDDNQEHPPFDPKQTPKSRDISTAAQFRGGKLKREQGIGHADALRRLAMRWLKILWNMWTERVPHDADRHLRDQVKHGSWVIGLMPKTTAQSN